MHTTLFLLLELLLRFNSRHHAIVQNLRRTSGGELKPSLDPSEIVLNRDLLDSLAPALPEFELQDTDQRRHELADFITQMTEAQLAWLQEVRDTFWHEEHAPSQASKLFMSAKIDGIKHSVAYSIIRAFMAFAEFSPPKKMHQIAYSTYHPRRP